jgi:hypothetical protein
MFRVALLVLIAACGSSSDTADQPRPAKKPRPPVTASPPVGPVVDPAGFDRTCTAATDCVVVKRAGCDPCACATEAIASKDMAKFDEALAKLACPEPDLSVRCSPCQLFAATCEKGGCVAVPKF